MARAQPTAPPERVELYDRLIATQPSLTRKGATLPYTSINGNMSSYLDASGALALRLSPDDRQAFMTRYAAGLHEAYGIVQKEYVTVPDDLLAGTEQLRPWFEASVRYVSGLRPKATTRKR